MKQCSQAPALVQRTPAAVSMRRALPSRTVRACANSSKNAVSRGMAGPSSASARLIKAQRSLAHIVPKAAATEQEVETEQQTADPRACYLDAIMFQAFGWESCHKGNWYGTVQSKIEDYKRAGFTHIWLPPPSSSPVAPQGYMPGQLYNLTSKYGNEQQLIELNKKLTEAGIKPLGDIVINHRCACEQGPDGVWNRFGDDVDHEGHKIDWDQWAITSNDPHFKGTGNPDTGEDFGPAPDLDHANPELREGLKHWLDHLHKNVGFAGWRFDYSKGYGARFVQEYIDASVGEGTVNVGEYWTDLKWNGSDLDYNQDGPRQTLCDWINGAGKRSAAFDFPTKGILQEAVKHCQYNRLRDSAGKAPGLIGWWPKMAVTFIDNHDTGSTQAHWPFPADGVGAGYAYIITHPGTPCIFWEHYFDWGSELQKTIDTLIQVRKRNNIQSNAKLEILAAEHDMYVAKINDRVLLKMGPRYDMGKLVPNKEEWVKAVNGKDFCVWEKK